MGNLLLSEEAAGEVLLDNLQAVPDSIRPALEVEAEAGAEVVLHLVAEAALVVLVVVAGDPLLGGTRPFPSSSTSRECRHSIRR